MLAQDHDESSDGLSTAEGYTIPTFVSLSKEVE